MIAFGTNMNTIKIDITNDIKNLIDKKITDEIGIEFDKHIKELQKKM
jgi:hypothetical protein